MQPLDPLNLPLNGRCLLEASAGTGKTWTLSLLVLRLLVEQGLGIDQILVLTYTRAATAELRTRIRERLRQAHNFLRDSASPLDPSDLAVLERVSRKEAGQRLEAALNHMEEAHIATIHSFCQQVLQDQGFEAGLVLDQQQILANEDNLREEIMADFWRRRFYPLGPVESAVTASLWKSPTDLLKWVAPALRFDESQILPQLSKTPGKPDWDALQDHLEEVSNLWQREREAVCEQLLHDPCLSRSQDNYRHDKVNLLILDMDALAAPDSCSRPLPGRMELLSLNVMEQRLLKKKCKEWRPHPFFAEFEGFWTEWQRLCDQWKQGILREARIFLREELRRRKARQGQTGYDDMLTLVAAALTGPNSALLLKTLRETYRAVLVDEFQDTDPVQYRIFSRLCAEPGYPFFMIGDPKQAIYAFRGGDIFTYMQAKKETGPERVFSMNTNFRSSPGVLEVVNALFSRQPDPFDFALIPFVPVQAGGQVQDQDFLIDNQPPAPLHLFWLSADEKERLDKGEADRQSLQVCAQSVRRLLDLGQEGRALIKGRPLAGGDLAILVQTNIQASQMQAALRRQGIASVAPARQSVFCSPEAGFLQSLLSALLNPADRGRCLAVLATPLFGRLACELLRPEESEAQTEHLREYQRLWQRHGVGPMLYRLFRQERLAARLSALPEGERALTNYLHLHELLHEAERTGPGMERLARWLARERQNADQGSEEDRLMRLESDGNLVRISTWHRAKGLEYPLVFLPFLWRSSDREKLEPPLPVHDRATEQACLDFQPDTVQRNLAREERDAEWMRLLYVALTRAKYSTFACWGQAMKTEKSALARLLHQGMVTSEKEWQEDVLSLNQERELVRLVQPEEELFAGVRAPGLAALPEAPPLQAREFTGSIRRGFMNSSYTAMTAGLDLQDSEAEPAGDEDLMPVTAGAAPKAEEFSRIDAFPRGARAGSCLHTMLEKLDFVRPAAEQGELIGQILDNFGIDRRWQAVLPDWLDAVLHTPLPGSRVLSGLLPQDAHRELRFWFPVTAYPALCRAFDLPPGRGTQAMMTGAMDLVFRHKGRYYIADYKSNHLGDQAADYTEEAMQESVRQHQYQVQYHLYTLALHRHLRARLAGYDYERDFGGVYYLFVRGMSPEGGWGVFRDRPDQARIQELDALCGQNTAG